MLPARRKAGLKGGIKAKDAARRSFPRHRKWIRGFACSVPGCEDGPIEAAHVTMPLPEGKAHLKGGVSQKWHDAVCISLCRKHHADQHSEGWERFAKMLPGGNPIKLAFEFAGQSPVQEVRDAVK